jgi:hypothetical protein
MTKQANEWFIYYGAESDNEVGWANGFSEIMRGPDDVVCFVKSCLYGDEEPESGAYAYDEYVEMKKEAAKTPFDIDKVLVPIAPQLHDAGAELMQWGLMSDLKRGPENFSEGIRKSFRGSEDGTPLQANEEAAFIGFIQGVRTATESTKAEG